MRLGTAGTVRHVPGLEYGKNGQGRVFVRRNGENAISDQPISHQSPRREDTGCWVSWTWKGESCDRNTPGHASLKPHGWMPSLPTWHCKDSADTLETHRIRWVSTRLMQTDNYRADSISAPNPTSTRSATHATRLWYRSLIIPNSQFAS